MPQNYNLNRLTEFITGEIRALSDKTNDPVKLNFKFFIDFSIKSGLFADESNVNSALGYLNRIGEKTRYNLLKIWIVNFKKLITDYEHLFMSVDGLEVIQNAKPYEVFDEEENKINIKIYEPIDLKFHSLITTYRKIVYDDVRGVEVLPVNLQRFNCHFIIYNYGYYNELLYGNSNNERDIVRRIFPTIEKVSKNRFSDMNHLIFKIEKCTIDVTESGKDFLSDINNEMTADYVMNNFTFKFKMAQYSARYNSLYGDFDFDSLILIESLQKNYETGLETISSKFDVSKLAKQELINFNSLKNQIKAKRKILSNFVGDVLSSDIKEQAIRASLNFGENQLRNLDFIQNGLKSVSKVNDFITNLTGAGAIRLGAGLLNNLNTNRGVRATLDNENQKNNITNQNITLGSYNIYDGSL